MLGAVGSQLGYLQLGQLFTIEEPPDDVDLDLCDTTVESLMPHRLTACLGPERTVRALGTNRRTKAVCE